jgi:soluble lytic murein transglycosylase-like protein
MIAIARCESGLNPQAYNRSSGASGLFQFLPGTWRTTPFASYSIFDPWASANAAAWMWSQGRRGEWVC